MASAGKSREEPAAVRLTSAELEAGLEHIRASPRDAGILELIVVRPRVGKREIVEEAQLDPAVGVRGDNWESRGDFRTRGGPADPEVQVTIMNARAAALVAHTRDRWALAGDQLYVDFDLSGVHLSAGTRLAIGSAVLEVSAQPHTGCAKFVSRFGVDAMKFVNSPVGRELNLRGINARVVQAGTIRRGDAITRWSTSSR
jgi:MOSC domain-containing protein YiiM